MNTSELVKNGNGYTVVTVGNIAEFEGKAFLKETLATTGMEVSFGTLPAGAAVPFNHKHKQNEEVYNILSGKGVFTLDGETVEVEAGSVVRIAPAVSRCTTNNGTEPLAYICIQAKEGSLEGYTFTDAIVE